MMNISSMNNSRMTIKDDHLKAIFVVLLMVVSAFAILAMLHLATPLTTSNQSAASANTPVKLDDSKVGVYTGAYDSAQTVDPNMQVSIMVALGYQNVAQMNQFLSNVQDPSSSQYHHFMTQDQFINAFSPAVSTYNGLVSYFSQQGLVAHTYKDRIAINLVGTFGQMESAFHTQIYNYKVGTESFYAPATSLSLNTQYANSITTIQGLNDRWHAKLNPLFSGSGSGETLYGTDMQAAYQLNQLYSAGYPSSLTIVTMLWSGYNRQHQDVGPYYPADISNYLSQVIPANQPQPTILGDPIGGAPAPGISSTQDSTQANYESTLDLEMVGSVAPGATVIEVYGPQATTTYLDQCFAEVLNPSASSPAALHNTVAISNSWGGSDGTDSLWTSYEQQAAAVGITVLASSGDNGNTATPSFPATSAYNTYGTIAVGGTTTVLSGTTSIDGTGTTGISSQTVWYNTPAAGDGSQSGVSSVYAEPSWQSTSSDANGVISAIGSGRATADISAVGANMEIWITSSSGSAGMVTLWGTSVASPLVAGVVAVMDNYMGTNEGFFAPDIYTLGQNQYNNQYTSSTNPFFDVTTGATGVYPAHVGYDLPTGWGSINAMNFINAQAALSGPTYVVTFTESGLTSGTSWSVTLNGVTQSSTTSTITFSNIADGSYSYTVNSVSGYTSSPSSGTVTVNGANVNQAITFTAIPTYNVTFTESGLTSGTSWYVVLNGVTQSSTSSTITFTGLADGSYSYIVNSVSGYTSSPSSGTVTVNGANVNQAITFTPVPTYSVTFTESGLASGTSWSVTLAGSTQSSTSSTITFTKVAGSYSYSVGGVSGYTASPSSGSVTIVSSNVNTAITFTVVQTPTVTAYSYVNGPTSYNSLSMAEQFTVGSSSQSVNFISLILSGSGTVSVSIGSSLWGTDVIPAQTVSVTSSQTNYTIYFSSAVLTGGTSYYLSVNLVSGSVQGAYTKSATSSVGAIRDYYYNNHGRLRNDNRRPLLYSVGYDTTGPAVISTATMNSSSQIVTAQVTTTNPRKLY